MHKIGWLTIVNVALRALFFYIFIKVFLDFYSANDSTYVLALLFILIGVAVTIYDFIKWLRMSPEEYNDYLKFEESELVKAYQEVKEHDINRVDKMRGPDFEQYCAALLRSGNFRRVEVTPASNDYGADIIAEDYCGNRWVIQCKRYKGNLSNSPVQEVVGSKAHYRANRAAVITTAGYTKGAKRLAKDNEVVLIDRKGLEKMMRGREITLENLVLYDIITED